MDAKHEIVQGDQCALLNALDIFTILTTGYVECCFNKGVFFPNCSIYAQFYKVITLKMDLMDFQVQKKK